METMTLLAKETQAHWATIAPILSIRNERRIRSRGEASECDCSTKSAMMSDIRFTACSIRSEPSFTRTKKRIIRCQPSKAALCFAF